MKPSLRTLVLSGLMITGALVSAQRYLNEIFTNAQIEVTADVPFATNIDFLTSDLSSPDVLTELTELQTLATLGQPYPPAYYNPADTSTALKVVELKMDIYEPSQSVDTEDERPVMLYLHTGNLLPPPLNSSPNGTKLDSCAVEMCRRMARRGYVSVAIDYRLGWNPIASTVEERRGTLLNAVYRAIHDTKMAVRELKEDADAANTYAINTEKIFLQGEGTGGYMALAYVTLNHPEELFIEKFRPDPFDPTISYVDTNLVGSINGYGGNLNLYRPNGYDDVVKMCVNMGGALADTSWLEDGDVPMVTFHTVRDDFAPFDIGIVYVPINPPLEVVELMGANSFMPMANAFGNNDAFVTLPDGDPYTDRARSLYGTTVTLSGIGPPDVTIATSPGAEGLFPMIRPLRPPFTNEASPWQWWDPASPLANVIVDPGPPPITAHQASLSSNPDMSPEKGRLYIDTIMGYENPRVVCALQLGPCSLVNIDETSPTAQGLEVSPIPAHGPITVNSTAADVWAYDLFDVNGRLVRNLRVNARQFIIERDGLVNGTYYLQLHLEEGAVTRKLVLE